jgi:hypothetical protein
MALSLFTRSCGAIVRCSGKPRAHDPDRTPADITHCTVSFQKLAADYKTKVTAAHDCARSKTVCTTDAKTEPTATEGAFASSASQVQAATACLPE